MGACHSGKQSNISTDNNTLDTVTMSPFNNTLDTVTIARQDREENGPYEVEVSYGREVDLHRHLNACKKNPGHLNFVPVDEFNMDHLPPGYHDNDLIDIVRAMSDLTVRVSVKYVSYKRPEFYPGSDKPYPCYKNRKSNMMRVGTGRVGYVEIYPSKYLSKYQTCTCEDCKNYGKPRNEFARIGIHTATHVVFDEQEADYTTCHLFFDRGSTPDNCSGVVTLSGMDFLRGHVRSDWSWLIYNTHDMDLAKKLHKNVGQYDRLRAVVNKKYPLYKYGDDRFESLRLRPLLDKDRQLCQCSLPIPAPTRYLTIIVSHPHGCSKQVSVGFCVNMAEITSWQDKYMYTTATCPGSSGAGVYVVEERVTKVHCGNLDEQKELNYSSSPYPFPSHPVEYRNELAELLRGGKYF